MSGFLAAGSCPTVVVNKQKKKTVAEMDQESSAGIALYDVVDETKKKEVLSPEIHKNYDENAYSNEEAEYMELRATRKEESTYCVPQRDKTSEVVLSKTLSSFNHFGDKGERWKISGSISQVWLCLMIVIFAIAFLTLAIGISAGVLYTMISRLRAEISSSKSEALVNSLRYELLRNETYNNSFQLSAKTKDIKNINMSIFNALNDSSSYLFKLVNQLNMSTILNYGLLKNRINIIENVGRSMFAPAHSCQAIHMFQPSFTSGYYWVRSSNGSSVRVYCDMAKSCGNITGGLTRVAILNNENRRQLCTDDFTTTNENTQCVRVTENPGCSNIVFPEMNIPYSHICGTVQGFWFGTPDGFTGSQRSSSTINDNYVDGISLTYGTSNKTHIWTFIADGIRNNQNCPRQVPEYVRDHYSCLNPEFSCTSSSSSCYSPFFRLLQQPVTEDIELRLCRDQHRLTEYEGIYLGNIEIYVW